MLLILKGIQFRLKFQRDITLTHANVFLRILLDRRIRCGDYGDESVIYQVSLMIFNSEYIKWILGAI